MYLNLARKSNKSTRTRQKAKRGNFRKAGDELIASDALKLESALEGVVSRLDLEESYGIEMDDAIQDEPIDY